MPEVCIIPMQQKLFDLYDSGKIRRPVGAYNLLTSDANRTQNPVQVSLVGKAVPGRNARYQITYIAAECDPVIECGETGSGICDTGSSENEQTDVKTITQCLSLKNIQITMAQFRDLCKTGYNEFVFAQLLGRLDIGMQAINTYIETVLCANAGAFVTGDAVPRDLNLINSLGAPNFAGLHRVAMDFMDVGVYDRPLYLGGRALETYRYGMSVGGQTANGSQFREETPNIFYSNTLDANCPVADRKTVLAVQPGVAQFVNYLYNVGDFQTNISGMDILSHFRQNDAYVRGVFEDPATGYIWDMSMVYDVCTDTWKINLKTTFDVWVLRMIQCGVTGYTGIFKYGACPYVAPACTA